MARRNRGVVYRLKVCEICGDEYVPTSGRQRACSKESCRQSLAKSFNSRRVDVYAEKHPRITEKQCEWPAGCETIFSVASTGVIPDHCNEHKKARRSPGAKAATEKWRLQTINIECRFWNCRNLQHPSGCGWCFFHYPILSMHGLTADDWWEFYEFQNGVCVICQGPLCDGRIIAVDHDHDLAPSARHDKEHVRGLLHAAPCNSIVVGGIETAIANGWYERVLTYIKFPPSESN